MMDRLYNGTGMLQKVKLLKRGPDQQQGTVTPYILFGCRRSVITRKGQTIDGKLSSQNRTTWHIPQQELDRIGVDYITALDRIQDIEYGTGVWQVEASDKVMEKLLRTHIDCYCIQTNNA
jgi:hypothetical protein